MRTRDFLAAILGTLITSYTDATASTWKGPNSPTTNDLTAVTQGAGAWVVVGRSNTVLVSQDGLRWAQVQGDFGGGGDFLSLAYGNGLFVAGGTLGVLRCTSPDGRNWTVQANTSGTDKITGVAFGNGRFVAVGAAGGGSLVISSTNGTDWTFPTIPTTGPLNAVTFSDYWFHGERFVAVGASGTILTSTNGTDWARRDSPTRNTLRAVSTDRSRFVAGGDLATVVISYDGVSWVLAPQPSFDVRGLVQGDPFPSYSGPNFGPPVTAVGNYKSEGRLHTSAVTWSEFSWPGQAEAFPQPLNAIAFSYWPQRMALAVGNHGSMVTSTSQIEPVVNAWTSTASGYWEDPYWSAGELPVFWQERVAVTNEGSKILTVSSNTVLNHFGSLQLNELVIDAPAGSHNLLLLDHIGFMTPLDVAKDLVIGPNGSLTSYKSWLKAGTLEVSNRAVFAESGRSEFGMVRVSSAADAELVLSNGWFSADRIAIGRGPWLMDAHEPGAFIQRDGTNQANLLLIASGGTYNIEGGNLLLNEIMLMTGDYFDPAHLVISGGAVTASRLSCLGIQSEVFLSGGVVQSGDLQGFLFSQSGGLSMIDNIHSRYELSGGTLLSVSASDIVQSGGVHTNRGTVRGPYELRGGVLDATHVVLDEAVSFVQTGASTARIDQLTVDVVAQFALQGGLLYTSNVLVAADPYFGVALFTNSGGTHIVGSTLTLSNGAAYTLQAGTLSADKVWIGTGSELRLQGGAFDNNRRFIFSGGSLQLEGEYQIGSLILRSNWSSINLVPDRPAKLQFPDSHTVLWEPSAHLSVHNWSGASNGGGAHRIYLGSNPQGLAFEQLNKISFADPAGFAPGLYPSRLLSTGELVPGPRPSISYTRRRTRIVLNWPTGYDLLTATNVQGPYYYLSSSSPYTNLFGGSRRFFKFASP